VAAFAALGAEFVGWDIRRCSFNPAAEWRALASLWRILRQHRPDLLFANTIKPVIYGLLLAALCGVPRRTAMIAGLGYAFLSDDTWPRRLVGLAARLLYRCALACAHLVIFQNQDDIALFRRLRIITPSTPVARVNGSGVDLTRFAAMPFPPGPPVFLFVGRLLRDKGLCEFIEAARRVKAVIPAARCVIVGATDSNPSAIPPESLRPLAADGLVELRGHVPDPRPDFAEAHIFVLPSYREGLPRAALEAMASARPVITTDVAGCRDTVADGVNGLLVPPRQAAPLAEAMIALGRDLKRAEAMGLAGRALCAARFELDAVTRATAAMIETGRDDRQPSLAAPLLSICVPTYNRRDRMLALAHAVLSEPGEFELCVHDDGSSDGTLEALRAIGDPRLKLSHGPNRGPASAFLAALRLARGRFAMLANDDDTLYPEGLRTVLSDCAQPLPPDIAGFIYHLDDEAGRRLGSAFAVPRSNFLALRADKRVLGDKKEVVLAEVLRGVCFDPEAGFRRAPISLNWSRISLTMDVICREVSIGRKFYLADGLTARMRWMKLANALPMFLLYRAHLAGYLRRRYRSPRYAGKAVLGTVVYGVLALAQGFLRRHARA
jgi:glycosyltransferase involved in cell wall biosynthesis